MDQDPPAWYCVRTRQKQEHIAAGNLRQVAEVEVFNPRLKFRRATQRGPVWFTEPLFPSYIFARFSLRPTLEQVRRTAGVSTVVHFADRFPSIAAEVIEELRAMTGGQELIVQESILEPGQEIRVATGAFQGLTAVVKQVLPAAQRVRILLELLGRDTAVEIDVADIVPVDQMVWKRSVAGPNTI